MARQPDNAELPTLAYVYHPESFAPLSIIEAAESVCQLVWIVDSSQPAVATLRRLLERFGPVVDAAGRSLAAVAESVRDHAPDGIVSLHDADLVWTALLAEHLGLAFHSVETAIALTDKHVQRRALAEGGLPVPAFRVIPADADAMTVAGVAREFPFPAVLKPRRGQQSRDTLPIESGPELEVTVRELRARPGTPAEEYILEGYVPDTDAPLGGEGFANFVSVESVIENGRVAHASISARTPFRWPFRETGYFTPSALSPDVRADVLRAARDAALAVGVTVGCLHTEIKLTDAGPVVIEVNGRPGGGMSEMLERASGFSILRAALRLAVGAPVELEGPVPCDRIGYLLYVFPPWDAGVVDTVEGLSDLRAFDGVEEIVLVRGPGQRIDWREGSEAHVFHFTGTARDLDGLRRVIAASTTRVRINGHD
ncbi:ATP-grasp domain-containing protein [Agromyces larvae]|uniref:ATP-grasp domain-containing protein n=1 Tax=Agromyces larvae TaxID=2929802 RepID=A0ABY4BU85_9MICO|nr:ATP-grasp domain-containing protein [Agromyces larvae]UOE42768.1 ATP-grasp domain-containing protein [Agromyces larvae]